MSPKQDSQAAPNDRELAELRAELHVRASEAEWLKTHYEGQLRAAFAQISALQVRIRGARPAGGPVVEDAGTLAELNRLRDENKRLQSAESRYLDRIEELKEGIARVSR